MTTYLSIRRRVTVQTIVMMVFVLSILSLEVIGQSLSNIPMSISAVKGLNTGDNEYAPCNGKAFGVDLIFTSNRPGVGRADMFKFSGSTASTLENVNTPTDDGAISVTDDGRTAVFASERSGGEGDVDIYIANVSNGQLTNIRLLPNCNSPKWDAQPCITADGSTIYFASNRSGGLGGTDIWMTSRIGDSWAKPICLADNVNTYGHERSPSVTADGGTLFIASEGHPGFGGFDIFMFAREGATTWKDAINVGGLVNSSEDELFMYAPLRGDYFYFSSSRKGGSGGLDIFQGTPNIFGAGTSTIVVALFDSVANQPAPGIVTIYDEATQVPIAVISADGGTDTYPTVLPAGRKYRIEAQVVGFPNRSLTIEPQQPNSSTKALFNYGKITFDFGKYNIPFFVSGYYRPNTPANLEDLIQRRSPPAGDLMTSTYIQSVKRGSKTYAMYSEYSQRVNELFTSVIATAVDTLFPAFANASGTEYIEILVAGYADPQPILGKYMEENTVEYETPSGEKKIVEKETPMTNDVLSGLRGYYSAIELERMIIAAEEAKGVNNYQQLKSQNKIRWRYVGGGVNNNKDDFATQRKIRIEFTRVTGSSKKGAIDTNKK